MRLPDASQERATLDRKRRFLEAFAKLGVITYAARKAGVARKTVYEWKADDPDFAAAYGEALEESTELLEAEAYRRGHDGVLKPVFQLGHRVGSIRQYSDTLLIFLLKARKPDVYRDRHEVDVRAQLKAQMEITIQDARQAAQTNLGPDELDRIARGVLGA